MFQSARSLNIHSLISLISKEWNQIQMEARTVSLTFSFEPVSRIRSLQRYVKRKTTHSIVEQWLHTAGGWRRAVICQKPHPCDLTYIATLPSASCELCGQFGPTWNCGSSRLRLRLFRNRFSYSFLSAKVIFIGCSCRALQRLPGLGSAGQRWNSRGKMSSR